MDKRTDRRPATILAPSLEQELSSIGLDDTQIAALAKDVGPIRFVLRERSRLQELSRRQDGPTIRAQREALTAMLDAANRTIEAFTVATNLIDPAGLGMVLRQRLDDAAGGDSEGRWCALLDAAHEARLIVSWALAELPTTQTRDRAPLLPCRLVHERTGIKPSTSDTSRFRRVVAAMYEAAGFPDENPDAAIRKYIAQLKEVGA